MNKKINYKQAVDLIKDGDTIMVGGFLGVGTPEGLIDALVASGKKDLTLICNDSGFADKGVGKLVVTKQFKKVIASHIGTNKETGNQMNSGETEVILVPQGTLAEQVRAAGSGLGGILTRTGIGTAVQEGKALVNVDGVDYILEKPLRADVALLYGTTVDAFGNAIFSGSTQNFNTLMAMAAEKVIIEAEHIVPVGEIDPNHVKIPGIFIDHIVQGEVL